MQQNGIFSNPHHHNQQPHMESDPPDSRKRPLETPTEASSTKRTNTGGKTTRQQTNKQRAFPATHRFNRVVLRAVAEWQVH